MLGITYFPSSFPLSASITVTPTSLSVFTFHQGHETIYHLLYFYIITYSNQYVIMIFIARLSSKYSMTELVPLSFFLSISVTRSTRGLFLYQSNFAKEILSRMDMTSCNPCGTPTYTKPKLSAHGNLIADPTLYWSLVGALQYLTFTRPYISYAFQKKLLIHA